MSVNLLDAVQQSARKGFVIVSIPTSCCIYYARTFYRTLLASCEPEVKEVRFSMFSHSLQWVYG